MSTWNSGRMLVGVAVLWGWGTGAVRAAPPPPLAFGPPTQFAWLEKETIKESSGLAPSWHNPDLFWTHNDSGDESRLFAFDRQGRHVGTSELKRAKNDDWEALDSFQANGKSYLLIGDVGDNAAKRRTVALYLFEEPADPRDNGSTLAKITFQYVDGPLDCEAMALDTARREVLLMEKQLSRLRSRVYVLPWPDGLGIALGKSAANASSQTGGTSGAESVVYQAQRLATVPHLAITGLDVSADNRHLVINTYGDLFVYSRQADEDWTSALARPAIRIPGPTRRQGEAVCFDHDGLDIVITSEGKSAPLWRASRQ